MGASSRHRPVRRAPYRLSETPWQIRRRPPLPGEHNAEILAELGVPPDRQRALHAAAII